ncbi:HEPN domain-containing protein [Anabaena sp. UHCC 0187]|uniref:HEPN domain-containing protein n=1 Tax=Anabaena sp. UHCC 0187 TaxID=2590018 RepID=UPI001C2BD2D7|nr:HEPN domain-containing protein [Anabaena sp. UHCC 0187]
MNQDEIDAKIAQVVANIDRRLASENKSVFDRVDIVKREICHALNMNINIDPFNFNQNTILLLLNIDIWYERNYKIRTNVSNFFQEKPFFIQGDIYWICVQKITGYEYYNIRNGTNLPEIVIKDLTEQEYKFLQEEFKRAKIQWTAIENLQSVIRWRDKIRKSENDFIGLQENIFYLAAETIKFLSLAIEDLNLAILTLKNTSTSNYQFIIFPLSQAIEKLLKACIISENLMLDQEIKDLLEILRRNKYGHNLLKIVQDYRQIIPFPENIESEIQKYSFFHNNAKSRYDIMPVSSEQAVGMIDAALNIFQLISEKLYMPLEEAMYGHEYSSEISEYYDQLEDDNCDFD